MLKFSDALISNTLTTKSKISNYATFGFASSHSYIAGDTLRVTGQGADFDGDHALTSVGTNTVTFFFPGADVSGTSASGIAYVGKWMPRNILLTDSYQIALSQATANYITTPSAATSIAVYTSGNPGQLDLYWSAPSSTGIPNDGGTYTNTISYQAYNASIGQRINGVSSPYSFTGLANATSYWVTANTKNVYRAQTDNSPGVLGTTKTVRQYGSIAVNASWTVSYKGTNAVRTDAGGYGYHGYYGSTQGLQKSWYGYSFGAVPAGAVVTRADMYINSAHWFATAGGTLDVRYIGNSGLGWAPASAHDGGDTLAQPSWGGRTGVVGFGLNAAKVQAYIRGQNSMIIGFHAPGNSASQSYYGYKYGATQYGTPIYIDYYWDS
jgi:hypothetical protein